MPDVPSVAYVTKFITILHTQLGNSLQQSYTELSDVPSVAYVIEAASFDIKKKINIRGKSKC